MRRGWTTAAALAVALVAGACTGGGGGPKNELRIGTNSIIDSLNPFVAFNQDAANRASYGDIQNGAGFRRARLGARGSVTNNMNYFFQMDFGFFGRPTFTDVWVEWTDLPILGTVRAGQWKQPFSLEVVSSFRYTTFMERSSMFQAFDPFRHIGIGFYNHSEDLMTTWAARNSAGAGTRIR